MSINKKQTHIKPHDFVLRDTTVVHEMHRLGIRSSVTIDIICKVISFTEGGDKPCYAANEYFALLLDVSEKAIEKGFKELREKELIKTYIENEEMKDGMYKCKRRSIYITDTVKEWVSRTIDF